MITEDRSGLSSEDYSDLSTYESPSFRVYAEQRNLVFEEGHVAATGSTMVDAAEALGYLWVLRGKNLFFIDENGAAITAPNYMPHVNQTENSALGADDNGLSVFAVIGNNLSRNFTANGLTWSGWQTIATVTAKNIRIEKDLFADGRVIDLEWYLSRVSTAGGYSGLFAALDDYVDEPSDYSHHVSHILGNNGGYFSTEYFLSDEFVNAQPVPPPGYFTFGRITIELPEARLITMLELQSRQHIPLAGGFSSFAAGVFTIEGSNDNANWTTIASNASLLYPSFSGYTASRAQTSFTSNTTAYKYYRLWFSTNSDQNTVGWHTTMDRIMAFAHEEQDGFYKIAGISSTEVATVLSGTNEIRIYQYNSGSDIDIINTGVELPFTPYSISAAWHDDNLHLALTAQVPGHRTADVEGTETRQIYSLMGGIIHFRITALKHQINSPDLPGGTASADTNTYFAEINMHTDVDVLERWNGYRWRKHAHISSINGLLAIVAIGCDGTQSYPIYSVKCYTSKDGTYWSAPSRLALPAQTKARYGVKLIAKDNVLHAFGSDGYWTAKSTRPYGAVHPDLKADISHLLASYQMSLNEGMSAQFSLFESNLPAFLNDSNVIGFEHWIGGWKNGREIFYFQGYTETDEMIFEYQEGEKIVQFSTRDALYSMAERVRSENAYIFAPFTMQMDTYDSSIDSKYGGLANTAVKDGQWEVSPPPQTQLRGWSGVAFNTFQIDFWNGMVAADSSAEFILRALNENFYFRVSYGNETDLIFDDGNIYEEHIGLWGISGNLAKTLSYDTVFLCHYNKVYGFVFHGDNYTKTTVTSITTGSASGLVEDESLEAYIVPPFRGYVGLQNGSTDYFLVSNFQRPECLEDVIRRFAALAGIHDCTFVSQVTPVTTITGNAGDFQRTESIEGDIKCSFTPQDHNWRLCIERDSGAQFSVWSDGTHVYLGKDVGHDVKMRSHSPTFEPIADTQQYDIVYKEYPTNSSLTNYHAMIAVFCNDRFIVGRVFELDTYSYEGTIRVELLANGSTTLNDFHVPQLGEIIDQYTIDPNETPMAALQRPLMGYDVNIAMRGDSLHVWRSVPGDEAITYENGFDIAFQKRVDHTAVRTVVRVLGGYTEAVRQDDDLVTKFGTRFEEITNPLMLTEETCDIQAQRALRRIKERIYTYSIRSLFTPYLEAEDIIMIGDTKYIVDSISLNVTGPSIEQSMELRTYAW